MCVVVGAAEIDKLNPPAAAALDRPAGRHQPIATVREPAPDGTSGFSRFNHRAGALKGRFTVGPAAFVRPTVPATDRRGGSDRSSFVQTRPFPTLVGNLVPHMGGANVTLEVSQKSRCEPFPFFRYTPPAERVTVDICAHARGTRQRLPPA